MITFLEMNSPGDLRPAAAVDGLAIQPLPPESAMFPDVPARIGASFGWPSAERTAEDWRVWLSHPLRRCWLITHRDQAAGIADLEGEPDGDIEINTFGLLPEYIGRGLGGHALTLAVRAAWAMPDAAGGPARRVWLHTSSNDHPHALRNYLHRGFTRYQPAAVARGAGRTEPASP